MVFMEGAGVRQPTEDIASSASSSSCFQCSYHLICIDDKVLALISRLPHPAAPVLTMMHTHSESPPPPPPLKYISFFHMRP